MRFLFFVLTIAFCGCLFAQETEKCNTEDADSAIIL